MTKCQQPKDPVHAVNASSDSGASQGARRATEEAPGSARLGPPPGSNSELVPRARRRPFTNADKRRILHAAVLCTRPGEVGALMRREGVYWSSLSTWRRQREAADLAALAPQKRGPKANPARIDALQIAQLTRERDKLRVELGKARCAPSPPTRSIACQTKLHPRIDGARSLSLYSGSSGTSPIKSKSKSTTLRWVTIAPLCSSAEKRARSATASVTGQSPGKDRCSTGILWATDRVMKSLAAQSPNLRLRHWSGSKSARTTTPRARLHSPLVATRAFAQGAVLHEVLFAAR